MRLSSVDKVTSSLDDLNSDPTSAFKAERFVYGKVPEIEPPEDLR